MHNSASRIGTLERERKAKEGEFSAKGLKRRTPLQRGEVTEKKKEVAADWMEVA